MAASFPSSSVLCIFQGDSIEENALNLAFGLSRAANASLRVLHISTPIANLMDPYGAGAYAGGFMAPSVVDQLLDDEQRAVGKAKTSFETYAKKHAIKVCKSELELSGLGHPAALFIDKEDDAAVLINIFSRHSDFIVTSRQDGETHSGMTRFLPALLRSKRGLLFAPPSQHVLAGSDFLSDRVGLAWDGSAQALRALNMAIPLLGKTKRFYLFCVHECGIQLEIDMAPLAEILTSSHLSPIIIELEATKATIGSSILTAANGLKIDMLIMGAYGHNRLAEALVGGTTHYLLQNAELPLFMAH